MNKKTKTLLLSTAVTVSVIIILNMVQGTRRMSHSDHAQSSITAIAISIEDYRGRNDHYPDTLEELLLDPGDSENRDDLNKILHNDFGDQFGYQLLTNGYVITIHENKRWSYRFSFGNPLSLSPKFGPVAK
jgi:hypothetical protein